METGQLMFDGSVEVKRARGFMAELDEFAQVSAKRSGLLNYSQAAVVMGLHRSRITQFVSAGRLHPVTFFGRDYLGVDEVRAFACEERKRSGRPRLRDIVRVVGHAITDPMQVAEAAFYE
jgi:hypothetical protein